MIPLGPGTAEATFPRVELPGVDREQADSLRALLDEGQVHAQHIADQKMACLLAMLRLKKPIVSGVKGKPRKPTKHQRHQARMAARATYLDLRRRWGQPLSIEVSEA